MMPLNNILQVLEGEAERQIAQIEQDAKAEIERIRAQAKAEAATTRQKHLADIRAPLQAEKLRILNKAKLEALQITLETRETIIKSVLQAAAQKLANLPSTPQYACLLQQLTQEAVATLGLDGRLHLHVRDSDVELMGHIVQQMDLEADVRGDLSEKNSHWDGLGGVVVNTPDGRITLSNTLDTRLQRVAALYRAQIAETVFDHSEEE